MIARAAIGAGKATRDPFDQRVFIDIKFDHMIERAPAPFEQGVQRMRLRLSARIAIKDNPGISRQGIERLADDARHHIVRHQRARLHQCLCLQADGRAGLYGRAQHVTRGQLHHAAILDQPARLRPLAGTRRAKQNDVHRAHSPLLCAQCPGRV